MAPKSLQLGTDLHGRKMRAGWGINYAKTTKGKPLSSQIDSCVCHLGNGNLQIHETLDDQRKDRPTLP